MSDYDTQYLGKIKSGPGDSGKTYTFGNLNQKEIANIYKMQLDQLEKIKNGEQTSRNMTVDSINMGASTGLKSGSWVI